MPRFQITIGERDLKALAEQAAEHRRDVRDHAAFLLEQKIQQEQRSASKQKTPRDRQP